MRTVVAVLLLVVSFAGHGQVADVVKGWNLLGNSTSTPLNNVAEVFGDANKVNSVWKWVSAKGTWAFYSPALADGGAAYATSMGYDALTTVSGGEGFWVNAKSAFAAQLPAGTPVNTLAVKLAVGWNLVSVGDNITPRAFNAALGATPPSPGVIPSNVTSLWAWSATEQRWYFYAPSLDANGTLVSELANRGYLDFGTNTLTSGTGFWVNSPKAVDGALRYTDKVYALWTGKYPFVVTRTGAVRVKNMTKYVGGGFDLFNCVISSYALADGRIPLLCKDGVEFKYHELYIDPTKDEMHEYVGTLPADLSYTLWAGNFTIASLGPKWGDVSGGDPIHGWNSFAKVANGWYFTLPEEAWVLKFQDNTGNISVVKAGTFSTDGTVAIMFSYNN